MRIPSKVYTVLETASNIDRSMIKNYVHGYCTPSKQRAIDLENACLQNGINISKEKWIFGTPEERKQTLKNIHIV